MLHTRLHINTAFSEGLAGEPREHSNKALFNFLFSQRCCWNFNCSGKWRRVFWQFNKNSSTAWPWRCKHCDSFQTSGIFLPATQRYWSEYLNPDQW